MRKHSIRMAWEHYARRHTGVGVVTLESGKRAMVCEWCRKAWL